jgi:hypothetical protein
LTHEYKTQLADATFHPSESSDVEDNGSEEQQKLYVSWYILVSD